MSRNATEVHAARRVAPPLSSGRDVRSATPRGRARPALFVLWSGIAMGGIGTGCPATYEPGSLTRTPSGRPRHHARSLGCLELRAQVFRDRTVGSGYIPLRLTFGNACRKPVRVRFSKLTAIAHLENGRSVSYPLFDPRGEIGDATLDGGRLAHEDVALQRLHHGTGDPVEVCVEVSQVSIPPRPTPPICFDASELPRSAFHRPGPSDHS
jgi:hypothetical protein